MLINLSIRISAIIFVLAAVAFTFAGASSAEVPSMIQYQGRLTDDAGNPLDTAVELTFSIYTDSTGGSTLWTETHPAVDVNQGLFTVKLGSITPFGSSVFNGTQRWLGISINGGDGLEPRTPVVSTAYSIYARKSDTAGYAATAAHATTSQHADTADVALNAGSNGWVDAGSVVHLSTVGDSVGIGTGDPRAPLEVQGSVNAVIGESHGSGISIGVFGANDNSGIGVMGTSNDGRGVSGISITGFGGHFYGPKSFISSNLGIGTETPEEMLHVYKDNSGGSSYIKVQSDHATNWGETGLRFETPQNIWHFRMDDDANNNMPSGGLGLRSHNLDAEVMTWKENGNVGIGTINPGYPLEVVSSGYALRARSTGSGIGVYASSSSGFGVYSDAPENFFGGYTGFGQTSPTHRITVNGAIGIQKNGVTEFHLLYYNNGFSISETNVADYRLYVKEGGNVGIGTGNPTSRFYVNGNAHVAGTFHADAFESDAIGKDNIIDEVGIASVSSTTEESFTGGAYTYMDFLTKQITVPTAGYILATGCGYVHIDHNVTTASILQLLISDQPHSPNGGITFGCTLMDNVSAGDYYFTIPCRRLFYVTEGTHTFYMIGGMIIGNDATITRRQMDLLFLPTPYGSKNGVISTNPGDNISTFAVEDQDHNLRLGRDFESRDGDDEPAMVVNAALLNKQIEILTAKIVALENRLQAVEEK